ncbi:DnaJ domain-containing protein [Acidithiobacillus ferrivorans]|uniref:DnaJ domain-containing protein n=1 Tax=Acidithiobacillus ferrivorans TaxID=160808 RepID=A0ABY1MLE1_9PROT|nr:J domain-containing protein [Acidithiobacillus ferrivorans]SMH64529.1 DnaJ domain-containing protein [Acidithiobacillus ferrivorans]
MANDHYQTLGLDCSAGTDDIRIAYRILAARCHPDRNHKPEAREEFLRLREAYEVLVDPDSREAYLNREQVRIQEKNIAIDVWESYLGQLIKGNL